LELKTEIDVLFPVLHGTFGEDGTLQGLLELADLAYTGPGVLGASLAMDKGVFKDVMRANGIPVLDHVLVLRSNVQDRMEEIVGQAEEMAPYPFFTKPANLGSSVGITKCRTRSDLVEGVLDAAQYDRRILIERGLQEAREIEVSVLGNDYPKASVPGEILPAGDFYSYDSKYHDDRSKHLIPAPLSPGDSDWVRATAIKAYQAIDCAGMARVDFLLDKKDGIIYLNEINTIPGFTQISMYPKLWEATGLPYSELLDELIELALDRKRERSQTVREFRRG
jgi:D-alanine-D-alanine ligase